ncbi:MULTISPECIES: hypothetical protein [Sporosarcina]|uniref:Lipoprotein n=1 Tax=Sporosarcina psychrophila TaxID=1476 RepID=A0ABV2KA46_SPOPS|nr:hypothetical protein [Sporosarcina psychrophila]AMQ06422.1 hypothetical protein AZE41_11065 [Sporosarcina psychrophila]
MNRINLLILIVFVLLTGCSRQETIRAAGEGEYWKAHVVYEVSNSELSDRGGIEYTGDEELIYVTFAVITSTGANRKGERYPEENQTAISFGTSVTNHPPTKDEAIIDLNHTYIEIKWQTKTGDYEEKVELKVN